MDKVNLELNEIKNMKWRTKIKKINSKIEFPKTKLLVPDLLRPCHFWFDYPLLPNIVLSDKQYNKVTKV